MTFAEGLSAFPLIAILRGVTPAEAVDLSYALVDAGFRIIEVPLNSPEPLRSIEAIAMTFPGIVVGAGTVMTPQAVGEVKQAGGQLILMPHSDGAVIRAAKAAGMACVPGVATPTEAFAALSAGADALKMFPAEQMPPAIVKAWRAVMPVGTALIPVGGIEPASLKDYFAAGAAGFGLGSALYKPGMAREAIAQTAGAFRDTLAAVR